jgi:hypothetical protein
MPQVINNLDADRWKLSQDGTSQYFLGQIYFVYKLKEMLELLQKIAILIAYYLLISRGGQAQLF